MLLQNLSLANIAWGLSVGELHFGTFAHDALAWEPSLDDVRSETFIWEPSLGSFRCAPLNPKLQLVSFRLGADTSNVRL